jgi:ubiquinone/menaquinone biosynthesis C-methylase UbiE
MQDPIEMQQKYYAKTATDYDRLHLKPEEPEHDFALRFLLGAIDLYDVKTILDVGAGTGRTINFLRVKHPEIEIIGIEPVQELREEAYRKGVSSEILFEGDGCNIKFSDQSFDLVCEFGVLHHVARPEVMISEMLRVAKKAIFISDNNNFGQGNIVSRTFKQLLNFFGAWKMFNFFRTKGKVYQISEGDGLFYSYSVFNNFNQIKKACRNIHLLNTTNTSRNFYRTATHVALLGVKK